MLKIVTFLARRQNFTKRLAAKSFKFTLLRSFIFISNMYAQWLVGFFLNLKCSFGSLQFDLKNNNQKKMRRIQYTHTFWFKTKYKVYFSPASCNKIELRPYTCLQSISVLILIPKTLPDPLNIHSCSCFFWLIR